MKLNLKDLEKTKIYYEKELKDEELAGGERNSYLKALEIIEKCIKREEEAGEKRKDKNLFLNPDGGLDLIERFPGVDYMPYAKKQIKKSNKKKG